MLQEDLVVRQSLPDNRRRWPDLMQSLASLAISFLKRSSKPYPASNQKSSEGLHKQSFAIGSGTAKAAWLCPGILICRIFIHESFLRLIVPSDENQLQGKLQRPSQISVQGDCVHCNPWEAAVIDKEELYYGIQQHRWGLVIHEIVHGMESINPGT